MTHSEAVQIVRNGEGAIVAELCRLSRELEEALEKIERLEKLLETSYPF